MIAGRVVLTCSARGLGDLAKLLEGSGVRVARAPLIRFLPPEDWGPFDAALGALGRFEAVAFTSPRSARAFRERLLRLGRLAEERWPTLWAVGPGTASELERAEWTVRVPHSEDASRSAGSRLAQAMVEAGVHGSVLFPAGSLRGDDLPRLLGEGGVSVVEVNAYRTVLADADAAHRALSGAAAVVVASPSVARLLGPCRPGSGRPAMIAIGATTAAALARAGWPADATAATPAGWAVARAVRELNPVLGRA